MSQLQEQVEACVVNECVRLHASWRQQSIEADSSFDELQWPIFGRSNLQNKSLCNHDAYRL